MASPSNRPSKKARTLRSRKDPPLPPPIANFDGNRFRSEDAQQRYNEVFHLKSLILSRIYTRWSISGIDYGDIFDYLGLSSLFNIERYYCVEAVRLFYTNMQAVPSPHHSFKTYVYGKRIKVDSPFLNTLLGCSVDEHTDEFYSLGKELPILKASDYEDFLLQIARDPTTVPTKPKAHDLNVKARVLHHMITYNLIPKDGNRDNVSTMELYCLYMIFTRRRFNVGKLIVHRMLEVLEDSIKSLPFNLLIMKILSQHGVKCPSDSLLSVRGVDEYTNHTLTRMGYVRNEDGVWQLKKDTPIQPSTSAIPLLGIEENIGTSSPPAPHVSPPVRRLPSSQSKSFDWIQENFDMMNGLLSSLASTMEKMEASIASSHHDINCKLDDLSDRIRVMEQHHMDIGRKATHPCATSPVDRRSDNQNYPDNWWVEPSAKSRQHTELINESTNFIQGSKVTEPPQVQPPIDGTSAAMDMDVDPVLSTGSTVVLETSLPDDVPMDDHTSAPACADPTSPENVIIIELSDSSDICPATVVIPTPSSHFSEPCAATPSLPPRSPEVIVPGFSFNRPLLYHEERALERRVKEAPDASSSSKHFSDIDAQILMYKMKLILSSYGIMSSDDESLSD